MEKTVINTPLSPAPIGPYSQAMLAGNLLFLSGQVAIDAANGQLITGNIADETRRVMENIRNILQAAGYDFSNVVKTTIFLSDMKLFKDVNAVYATYFDGNYPARETVAVAGLPLNVNVEISMIAGK